MTLRFDHPQLLVLLVLVVPVVVMGRLRLAPLGMGRAWLIIGLRVVVAVTLVLALADAQAVRRHTGLTVIVVADQSESVHRLAQRPAASQGQPPGEPPAIGGHRSIEDWTLGWLEQAAQGHHPEDRLGLLTYDGQPTVRTVPSTALAFESDTVIQPTEGTDTASALRLAMALFPANSAKRIVLISDGNDTASPNGQGLINAAREAQAARIPIDVLPIDFQLDWEVMVEALHAPAQAHEGQTIALRVVLRATHPATGTVHLKHDGQLVDLNGPDPGMGGQVYPHQWIPQQLPGLDTGYASEVGGSGDSGGADAAGEAGGHPLTQQADHDRTEPRQGRYVWVGKIELPFAQTGVHRFEAVYEPAAQADTIAANNQAQGFTLVQGKGRVLFVGSTGLPSSQVLPQALVDHGIELDVVGPESFPTQLTSLQRYDAVVLQDVPAEAIAPALQKQLASYVHDLGGGLIMVGGPNSFAAGGWTGSPIDRILPLQCQIPSQTVVPAGALVLVLDRSGSMSSSVNQSPYSKQEVANEAAVLALETLYPQDHVGVIAFDNSPRWIVPLGINASPRTVAQAVRSIHPDGGTNIHPALEQAYQALLKLGPHNVAVKHIVLLTDGQSQGGDYPKLMRKMVQADITLSTIGVGDDVNASLLAQLAQTSGGSFYPVSDPNRLPQVFIKEARTIRKNLIKELDFQPQRIETGSPIMAGIGSLPALRGFVLTGPKHDPRVFMPIVGPEGEPIFAHWQVGLGRCAAFTSDATNRWAAPWVGWGGYGDFWARTVRTVARASASRAYDLTTTIQGDRLRIRLDTQPPAATLGGPGGQPTGRVVRVTGAVLGPASDATQVTLEQVGPGVYETTVPAAQSGNYLVSLFVEAATHATVNPAAGGEQAGKGRTRLTVFGGVSRPPGQELRYFGSNRAQLEQVARLTGGRVLEPDDPQSQELFDRSGMAASRSIRSLWRELLVWLLGLWLVDVAVRRLGIDTAAIGRWIQQQREAIRGLLKPREVQAAATLAVLKQRAAQVDQRLTQRSEPQQADHRAQVDNSPFYTGPGVTDTPQRTVDLSGLIGATPPNVSKDHPTVPESSDTDPPATTSRLLDAKRRAHGRLDAQGGTHEDTHGA